MKTPLRRLVLLPLLLALGACSNLSERGYERCIVGFTAAGGAVGGGVSGGSGVLPGTAGGAALSTLFCVEAEPPPPPADSDGDGVAEGSDSCPGTPAGARVDAQGCALDSDGDGVPDYRDRCAGTPAGVTVDDVGCPVKDEVVLTVNAVNFAFDSAELDAASRRALDRIVATVKGHGSVTLGVIGHTDSSGPEAYNQRLSERRAGAVREYLVSQGVAPDALVASGRGEAEPVAGNDTREGREQNRRVELVVQ
ncbi:OmpA family protein [Pseudohaliea rubra]|uniref:Outer membrane protein A n=1 Tax=Pseudohaliea rubra DSM 19751 TaxID=1265313 RepID=A0A095XW84_9GAMM|nr:OmpA family protein [Pseudohaliea rubra]KGE03956.1 Outer membrane protein A precursor [Pseudohaliea rubra DSM 19751]